MPLASPVRVLSLFLCLTLFAQSDTYHEQYRPAYHFSPKNNWTNDPNGLVYFNGIYHLFFQYNPMGDLWGHMSWGHATSKDLVHWQQEPVALQEENGVMIFTGSAVVDARNTSGFCSGKAGCLVAVYTGHTPKTIDKPALQTQNLAYSNDDGRTWTKYARNPVLDLHMSDFRDPKVFWSNAARQWIMVVSLPDDHKAQFYGSPDLKSWSQLGSFGPEGAAEGQWECPDLIELPLDRKGKETRWVLKIGLNPGGIQGGSGEQYFIGRFDGKRFINDNKPSLTLWTDYGKDCYCALTFNNMPPGQPHTMMGWMDNWQYASQLPTHPWRGQMTVPRAVSLKKFPEGIRLVQQPIPGLERLRERHFTMKNLREASGQSLEILSAIKIGGATEVGWKVLAEDGTFTAIGYDVRAGQLLVDRTHSGDVSFSEKFPARMYAPFKPGSRLRLHILIDRSSVEVFAGDGQVAMTNLVFPRKDASKVEFYASGGKPGPVTADIWTLKSIW